MALSVNADGSQTATINTEHTLGAAVVTANVFSLEVDVSAMVGGATPDILEIRMYSKARSADTERQVHCWSIAGAQSNPLWVSPPFMSPETVRFTLKQIQGTGRAFPWSINQAQ